MNYASHSSEKLVSSGSTKSDIDHVALFRIPVAKVTMDDTLSIIEEMIESRSFHQIATANVDFLVKAQHDHELMEILHDCDLVLADGMPLVWASKLMGSSLGERVSGADLVPKLVELSSRRGYGMFILGGSEQSSAGAASWIAEHYPGANLVGRYSPPLSSIEAMDHEEILRRIEDAQPDILFVAFGNPKQEKWLALNRHRLHVPVCIGVGGSIDFLSGCQTRAPHWMQQSGLEWLFRMLMDPKRLASRYFSNAVGLLKHLPAELLVNAMQSRTVVPTGIKCRPEGPTLTLDISGRFTGTVVDEVRQTISQSMPRHSELMLDLATVTYLGPDAIGMIMHLSTKMNRDQKSLSLTGMRASLRRVCHVTGLGKHVTPIRKIGLFPDAGFSSLLQPGHEVSIKAIKH